MTGTDQNRFPLRLLDGTFEMRRWSPGTPLETNVEWPLPYFLARTDSEISLLIRSEALSDTPAEQIESGWRGIWIDQQLDFSLIGVVAGISGLLADHQVSLMAMSTFDTDYFFVRETDLAKAARILGESGYSFAEPD